MEAYIGTQMCSGSMFTSLTNTLLNRFMIVYAAQKAGLTLGQDYDFFVEGDDNIIMFINNAIAVKVLSTIQKLGFEQVTLIKDDLGDAELVGMKFYKNSSGTWEMYRDPARLMKKFGLTTCNQAML